MIRFVFIRHAAIDGLGQRIAGRESGRMLNAEGERQSERLAERLAQRRIDALYSSPQPRAFATAAEIGRARGLAPQVTPELDEVDFGDWTGKTYAELDLVPEWRAFNILHSSTRIPNGELLLEVQARVIGLMARLQQNRGEETVALVSHGDVIRVALAHQLGVPIDFIMRFEIGPASISIIELHDHGPRVLCVNGSAADNLAPRSGGW
jgi:broad specificity phosphatase PhoE